MKLKPLFISLLLILLPLNLQAEEKNSPFTLNGKLVPPVVAKVNGVELTSKILQRELFAFRIQSQRIGKEIKPREEHKIAREMLKSLVARELIVQKAKILGIMTTEKKINLELKNIEDQFPSHKAFITALAFQHMSIPSLKEKIKRTLLEDELMRREIAPKVRVKDEAIKKYYDENITKFTKPILYRVRHIHIATIKPAAKAQDAASQKKADHLTKIINQEAEQKINSLYKKVQAGEDFPNLAKQFSEDNATSEKGGLLGDFHPGSTIPVIADTMVNLKEGSTSGVIKSKFGYHILKLDEIIPSTLIPFSETKADIMNLLLKIETQELFTIYVEGLGNIADIKVFL